MSPRLPDARKTVLIVDDALVLRTTLKSIFSRNGFEVIGEASNGFQAVEQYERFRPNIVTMDIGMPELDGLEAMKQIRAFDSVAKIIVCTSHNRKEDVLYAMRCGACDFVLKPFEPERILEAISKAS